MDLFWDGVDDAAKPRDAHQGTGGWAPAGRSHRRGRNRGKTDDDKDVGDALRRTGLLGPAARRGKSRHAAAEARRGAGGVQPVAAPQRRMSATVAAAPPPSAPRRRPPSSAVAAIPPVAAPRPAAGAPPPKRVRVGTDFSGWDTPLMALENVGIPFRHMFSCEIDPEVRKV
ncbi:MAG: hypothetical protein GY772_11205, partial [bacterium]|nr:hypothetical protein [bacterium]